MAALSPSPEKLVMLSIPLFLLLFVPCQAVPINKPVNSFQNPNMHESEHFSGTMKPPAQTFSHDIHSAMPLSSRPSVRDPESLKPDDTNSLSLTNPTRPFARVLQSEATNQLQLRPMNKPTAVNYLSPPLRGTETRDRYALHIPSAEQKPSLGVQESNLSHEQPKQGVATDWNDPHQDYVKNATHPNSAIQFQNTIRSSQDRDPPLHQYNNSQSSWTGTRRIADETVQMSTTGKHHDAPLPKHHDQNPVPTAASLLEETRVSRETETRSRGLIDTAKDFLSGTINFGHTMYENAKSSIESLVSGSKSSSLPTAEENRTDGYSEEDVKTLVNDIIREIQMRSNDMGDHAKMLENTDRWDPNDITTRERNVGTENSPLLYMRTKVLVTPETLVDAVMASTEKLLSSKADKLTPKDMPKLVKEVQIKLVHMLTPAK